MAQNNTLTSKVVPVLGKFSQWKTILGDANKQLVNGVVFDVGLSSMQVKELAFIFNKRDFSMQFEKRTD